MYFSLARWGEAKGIIGDRNESRRWGRWILRAKKNYKGENIITAGPSTPAQIIGFKVAPEVGDVMDLSKAVGAKLIDVRQKKSLQTGAEKQLIFI